MITYWNIQLNRWAKWKHAHLNGNVGWPKVSPMFMEHVETQYGPREPEFNDDAEFVDKVVQKLMPIQINTVREFYFVGGKSEEIATRLGIHKATLFRRIDGIHYDMSGLAQDILCKE